MKKSVAIYIVVILLALVIAVMGIGLGKAVMIVIGGLTATWFCFMAATTKE